MPESHARARARSTLAHDIGQRRRRAIGCCGSSPRPPFPPPGRRLTWGKMNSGRPTTRPRSRPAGPSRRRRAETVPPGGKGPLPIPGKDPIPMRQRPPAPAVRAAQFRRFDTRDQDPRKTLVSGTPSMPRGLCLGRGRKHRGSTTKAPAIRVHGHPSFKRDPAGRSRQVTPSTCDPRRNTLVY